MISISGLLSIVSLVVYFLFEWYSQQIIQEEQIHDNSEYVPERKHRIKTNDDGTNDYSELYADAIEERKEARRAAVEMSSIEGTETKLLLSSLQQELDIEDNQPVYFEEEVIHHFQEEESIEHLLSIEEGIEVGKPITSKQDSFDVQGRIYELRHRLSEFSKEEADVVDIEAMIMAQYELFQLEGREDQVRQLEEDFFMYFPKSSSKPFSEETPNVYDEDILRMEDMEIEREELTHTAHNHSTSKISDDIFGLQRWRGKVIGKSENYIHFNDFTRRIWIKAGEKINKIQVGDELILEVIRKEEVTITQMFRVKNKSSQSHLRVVNQ
jgi:hypothetical protein